MLEFIQEYWLTFVFGLIGACLIFVIRQFYKSRIREQEFIKNEFGAELTNSIHKEIEEKVAESEAADNELKQSIQALDDKMELLKAGMLSTQGKAFKAECRKLLEPGHVITADEYEEIVDDHKAYNGLGGNHRGDALFKSVEIKYNASLTSKGDDEE